VSTVTYRSWERLIGRYAKDAQSFLDVQDGIVVVVIAVVIAFRVVGGW
jgi:hypothetical protein